MALRPTWMVLGPLLAGIVLAWLVGDGTPGGLMVMLATLLLLVAMPVAAAARSAWRRPSPGRLRLWTAGCIWLTALAAYTLLMLVDGGSGDQSAPMWIAFVALAASATMSWVSRRRVGASHAGPSEG